MSTNSSTKEKPVVEHAVSEELAQLQAVLDSAKAAAAADYARAAEDLGLAEALSPQVSTEEKEASDLEEAAYLKAAKELGLV